MAIAKLSVKLNPLEILGLASERRKQYAARDEWYDLLVRYYHGSQFAGGENATLAMNAQGRPLLRDLEQERAFGKALTETSIYRSNRLAGIVDDGASLIGRMPNSRIDPPDPSPQGVQKAELLTKFLYSTYEMSHMVLQQADAGRHLVLLGDSCTILDPTPEDRVAWTVINPRKAYPEFYKGYRRFEIKDLVVAEQLTASSIMSAYGFAPHSDDEEDCVVYTYLSPWQRTIIVGSRPERARVYTDVEWDLGFCPAAWTYNKGTPSMGMSDIGQSLAQQDFIDWAFSLMADGLVRNVYGKILAAKNPQQVGDNIQIGPMPVVVPFGPDGGLEVVDISGDIGPALQMFQQALGDMNASTGSSQVRQEGQIESSIITGKAVQAVQGPQSTRVESKQEYVADTWRSLNRMTLAMQEKAPGLRNFSGDIFGRYKGQSFREPFSPTRDIDGWYRNTVTPPSLIGMSQPQRLQVQMMGMQSGLWDDLHAMEQVGVDDPVAMRERIKQQKIEQAQANAQVAQLEQSAGTPPGAAPPPIGAPITGAGGKLGRRPAPIGMGRQAPTASAPSPQQQALPTGVPQGVSRKAVVAALEEIPSLKGTVWALGDLANTAQAQHVELGISDPRDQQKVLAAVRPLDPTVKVRYIPEAKLPTEAVRLI